jgi:hypothetical protein
MVGGPAGAPGLAATVPGLRPAPLSTDAVLPVVCLGGVRRRGVGRPWHRLFVRAGHVAVSPGYAGDLPYAVATVELAEGPRLLSRVDPPATLAIGDRVVARFVDHPTWTELYFAPEGASA